MAGITGSIPMEDARAVVELMIASGKVVGPARWVDGIIERHKADAIEAIF